MDLLEQFEEQFERDWTHLFLLVRSANADRDRYRQTFLQRLAQRHEGARIAVATLVNNQGPRGERRSTNDSESVSDLILVDDSLMSLQRSTHLAAGHRHGGLVVINRSGHIEFRSLDVPSDDTLRQLVEKFAFVDIDYGATPSPLDVQFTIGQDVPDWTLTDIDDGSVTRLPLHSRNAVLIVFAAPCSSCQFGNELRDLESFVAADTGPSRGDAVIAVFSSAYPIHIIRRPHLGSGGPQRMFVADSTDMLLGDLGTRFSDMARPLVVHTDACGRVTTRYSLPDRE